MFYLVGLGNKGEEYANTRHNVGWMALDFCVYSFHLATAIESSSYSGRISHGVIVGKEISVLYPNTFMNNSGAAVVKLVPKTAVRQLIVIHDDIDLPLGDIKVSQGRGAGGNNGVASIIDKMGTKDFVRIRIGIATKSFWTGEMKRPAGGGPLERFVLKPFTSSEEKLLPEVFAKVKQAIEIIIEKETEAAMNECN